MCLSNLLFWMIATAGLTSIIVDSKLLERPRGALLQRWPNSIGYLATCYQCAGTYCGGVCGAVLLADANSSSVGVVLASAVAGSAVSQVFAAGMNLIERLGVQQKAQR